MFKKASKEQCKLRLALFGVSGGGKTYSALRLAKGLGGKIALIDTEHKSASKYADRFDFDVCDLDTPTIGNLLMTIKEASSYDVLIIDSLTHAWQELIKEVERIARAKFGGNTWSAWSEGTPKQQTLINAILDFPGHIIVTMRSDTNWTTSINDRGKVVPVRIGEAPKQGKNIEYEFDMLIQLSQDHEGLVIKDRTGKYQDKCGIIDEQFGQQLGEWLSEGKVVTQSAPTIEEVNYLPIDEVASFNEFKQKLLDKLTPQQIKLFMKKNKISMKEEDNLLKWISENDIDQRVDDFIEECGK